MSKEKKLVFSLVNVAAVLLLNVGLVIAPKRRETGF